MRKEKLEYYALKTMSALEILLSGIIAAGAVFSMTQKQYEWGGFLACASLYMGVGAAEHHQELKQMKYRNKLRESYKSLDEEIKRNKEAFGKFLSNIPGGS